jgi:hypothetical protein
MHHGPRLAGTPETVCCHQTAVFTQLRSRSVLNKWFGRLSFVSLISDRPRRLSSLEACMSLTGISDLLTLPALVPFPSFQFVHQTFHLSCLPPSSRLPG